MFNKLLTLSSQASTYKKTVFKTKKKQKKCAKQSPNDLHKKRIKQKSTK